MNQWKNKLYQSNLNGFDIKKESQGSILKFDDNLATGETVLWKVEIGAHAINLFENSQIAKTLCRLGYEMVKILETKINQLEKECVIRKFMSPWRALIVSVKNLTDIYCLTKL